MANAAAAVSLCDIADTMSEPVTSPLYERLMAIMPKGFTRNSWAGKAGVNRTVFANARERGRLRSDILDKLLQAAGVSLAQFETGESIDDSATIEQALAAPAAVPRPSHLAQKVPVLGSALGHDQKFGDNGTPQLVEMIEIDLGETVNFLPKPPSIADQKDVFALYISGYSMQPRYDPGDPIFIDPHRQPSIGDDVVVQLRDHATGRVVCALVKRLIKRTAEYLELEQFNPPSSFKLPIGNVAKVQRIFPRSEIHR